MGSRRRFLLVAGTGLTLVLVALVGLLAGAFGPRTGSPASFAASMALLVATIGLVLALWHVLGSPDEDASDGDVHHPQTPPHVRGPQQPQHVPAQQGPPPQGQRPRQPSQGQPRGPQDGQPPRRQPQQPPPRQPRGQPPGQPWGADGRPRGAGEQPAEPDPMRDETPEVAADAVPVSGRGLARLLEDASERARSERSVEAGLAYLRPTLRSALLGALVRGGTPRDEAETAIDDGSWTDDREVAAALSSAVRLPDRTLRGRIHAWLYPHEHVRAITRQAVTAIADTAADEFPSIPGQTAPRNVPVVSPSVADLRQSVDGTLQPAVEEVFDTLEDRATVDDGPGEASENGSGGTDDPDESRAASAGDATGSASAGATSAGDAPGGTSGDTTDVEREGET